MSSCITQRFQQLKSEGRKAFIPFSELQGFLTISAKAPDRKNLVIFPDKLKAPSDKIEFTDPATGIIHQIP